MSSSKNVFGLVTARVRHAIARHHLLPPSTRILIAVSGGQDSLALAETMRHLNHSHQWPGLSLAHCDHRWPHDEGIAEHVSRYAARVHLPLHIIDAATDSDPPAISEAAGRDWRYARLAHLAQTERFDAVLTAHTRTDLAETVLFNLAHGSGADGLSALTWNRLLCRSVHLTRPLLDVSRTETAAICQELGLDIWHDIYNDDRRYTRNRIRQDVMPVLRKCINPQVERALARTAHLLRDEASHLQAEANALCQEVIRPALSHHDMLSNETDPISVKDDEMFDTVIELDRKPLVAASRALQRRVIRLVLRQYLGLTYEASTFAQVEAVCSLLHSDVGASAASLSGHSSAVVTDDNTIAIRVPKRAPVKQRRGNRKLGLG